MFVHINLYLCTQVLPDDEVVLVFNFQKSKRCSCNMSWQDTRVTPTCQYVCLEGSAFQWSNRTCSTEHRDKRQTQSVLLLCNCTWQLTVASLFQHFHQHYLIHRSTPSTTRCTKRLTRNREIRKLHAGIAVFLLTQAQWSGFSPPVRNQYTRLEDTDGRTDSKETRNWYTTVVGNLRAMKILKSIIRNASITGWCVQN